MGFTFRKSKENAPDEKMDSYRGRKTKTDRMKGVHNKGKSKGKRTPVISLPGSRVSKRKTSSAKDSSKKIHNNRFIKKKESLLPEEPKKKKGKDSLININMALTPAPVKVVHSARAKRPISIWFSSPCTLQHSQWLHSHHHPI